MKLSCLPVSFFAQIIGGTMTVGQWAEMGARVGLDGIDISILFLQKRTTSYLQAMRRSIEDSGLHLVMVTTYPDFTHPDPAERLRQAVALRQNVDVAAALGASYVRVTAGQGYPEVSFADGLAWASEGLIGAVEETRGSGVTLVFENHARPGIWTYPDFSFPTKHFLAIAEATAKVGLGINWDTANTLAYGDDPLPVLRQVIQRVKTVHAADTGERGQLRHVLLGTGLVPFRDTFAELQQAGFDGWICMEEGSNQGERGVRAAAAFVRHTWHDALAERSLQVNVR